MRQLQPKQYIIYLRANLKKNSLILSFLLFFPLLHVYAATLETSYNLDSNNLLTCSIRTPPMRARSILEMMDIGHRTEIIFTIRVYQDQRRFLRFRGNRRIKDYSVSYVATRDLVSGAFRIVKNNGQRITKENEEAFFNFFFSANDIRIDMSDAEKGDYYIVGRVEVRVIKLIPPLNLLSNILPGIITRTDWERVGAFRIN